MNSLTENLKSPFVIPALLTCVLVSQIVLIGREISETSADREKPIQATRTTTSVLPATAAPDDHATAMVAEAESAFQNDKESLAIGLLSAALAIDPANGRAIDTYRDRLRARFQAAVESHDWELAGIQVAAYDSTVRGALRGAATKTAVELLVARQEDVTRWEEVLALAREKFVNEEIVAIEKQLVGASSDMLSALDSRIRQLPTDELADELVEGLADLALRLVRLKQESRLGALRVEFDKLTASANSPGIDAAGLRELRVQAEQLNAQIAEARLQGAGDQTTFQAACQDVLSQLDQRLQINSIRQMQTIAEVDARKAVSDAKAILDDLKKNSASKSYQWRGGKLAEAELHLNAIDRLCSIAIQNETRQLVESIRKDAIKYRAQQSREYNLWAIGVLEASIADYKKAKGWFNDDEDAFMKTMREKVGQIDPQHLHPVTYSLFAEMFMKFLGELDPPQKVAVTQAVETGDKKPLSDF
jgi:hypothetical protein